jgi:hypothetical protein
MDLGFVVHKGGEAIVGLIGGLTTSVFWLPKKLQKKAPVVAGVIISVISMTCSIVFTQLVIKYLELNYEDYNLAISFIIGMCAVALVNFVTNWIKNHEDDDIEEIVKELK